jgi:hypothetical protein
MWNRSYSWQRRARLIAGVLVLVALTAASVLLAQTSAAQRTRRGAGDLAAELGSPARQLIEVSVPLELHTTVGTLVYRQREDGVAQIIGRVTTVEPGADNHAALSVRLSGLDADYWQDGAVLKGAPAPLNLRESMRLLVSPDSPTDEALVARDTIWPTIRAKILPDIADRLISEVSDDLAHPGPEDEALLKRLVENLHETLAPLEDNLVDRLARRAWDVVGVQGLAEGVWRSTAGGISNRGGAVAQWWLRWFAGQKNVEAAERPFLSEKKSQELREALEEEALTFWEENRAKIIEAIIQATKDRRADFENAFRDRWATALYDRVIEPAWLAGQDEVLDSIQTYVNDFASRRLVTVGGGPRLRFAYVLRGYLDISLNPLLILVPAPDQGPGRVVYQPLVR